MQVGEPATLEVVVRASEDVDRANEITGGGLRQNSTGQMSATGSSRSSSIQLTRELSDRVLKSIHSPRDSASEIPGDVYSSIIAQTGDRGDRVVVDGEEGGTSTVMHSFEEDQMPITRSSSVKIKLPRTLDYISYMIHLAVFGNLGVFTRYLLQKLFGPSNLALTSDQTPLYLDLPANMLGSFLMGCFGVVFKADIRDRLSDQIVVGITTGYLGSLTTFSGWNQKMLGLSSKGHWVFAVAGIILGMMIVNESIRIGVELAEVLRRSLVDRCVQDPGRIRCLLQRLRVDTRARHIFVMSVLLLVLVTLLGLSGSLARMKLDNVSNGAVLWLGCMVGPLGVWARWYLARLNGRGMGSKGQLKWLPIGTLLANVSAAFLMAALATISKAVNTKRCDIIIGGIQFGFLGCLSTVSTFVAEVYAMRQSGHIWRAVAYAAITILLSFAFGTLIYSLPVEREYKIKDGNLESKYKDWQKKLHPDLVHSKSEKEKSFAAEQSARVIDAYRTLGKPLSRAIYLLQLEGIIVDEEITITDPDLLTEMMEIRESVEEANDSHRLKQIQSQIQSKFETWSNSFHGALEKREFDESMASIQRMRYYERAIEAIIKKL